MSDGSADRVFELAAELFGLLAAPARLRILCQLRDGEKSVGEIVDYLGASQPNVSQHLRVLHRAGIVGRRRAGAMVFYRIVSEPVISLCDAVCQQRVEDAVAGQ
ncbi:ArsR/SmtB family transcription factor [Piscinibacter sakaiensis]|uniref:ArsR/SmtB family transcription factor n=1 Tax=Piscinibacter sakaiensis TaxID=1547922 RepID=UPI003AAA352C